MVSLKAARFFKYGFVLALVFLFNNCGQGFKSLQIQNQSSTGISPTATPIPPTLPPSPSATATPRPSSTPTVTPTPRPSSTPTATPRPSPTPTATPTPVPTVTPTPSPMPSSDFATRCADPNVIRCHGFESDTRFNIYDGNAALNFTHDYVPPTGGPNNRMALDTVQKSSGASSLKATIPSNTGANVSGSFVVRFSDDGRTQFGAGQEFYVQWRQRFSPEMLRAFKRIDGGTTAWKQVIIGAGDKEPFASTSDISWTCTILEMVSQQNTHSSGGGFPGFYHSCGNWASMEYWPNGAPNVLMQHHGPPYCVYPNDPQNGCFKYVANEWMTFQFHINIGEWASDTSTKNTGSRVQIWAARQGQPSVMTFDSINSHPTGFTVINDEPNILKYGKVWLLPYMTNKDPTETHATAYTWYDDLIISRKRIADPK